MVARTIANLRNPQSIGSTGKLCMTLIVLIIFCASTTGYMMHPYHHHGGGHPLHYLKVVRHRHPHLHHAASGHHSHRGRMRVHPTLHGHVHYEEDYPQHSGTHYHSHHPHYHNQGTLYGYQLQGGGQQAPQYQGMYQPQQTYQPQPTYQPQQAYQPHQSGDYYDSQNYYMGTPQSNGVQYNVQPQNTEVQYGQPQQVAAQYGQPQQVIGQYGGVQPQAANPYDQQSGVVNHEVGGSDYGGAAQNYGFHCKYSYGPDGKLELCKDEPPPAKTPQYGASVHHTPVASQDPYHGKELDTNSANSYGDPKHNDNYVDPKHNDNYVYVPAPWD